MPASRKPQEIRLGPPVKLSLLASLLGLFIIVSLNFVTPLQIIKVQRSFIFEQGGWIPLLFPAGRLGSVPGTAKIPVLRRIRVLYGAGTLNPMILLVSTLLFAYWELGTSTVPARETVKSLRGSFELRKETPTSVKGYSKPVTVYSVIQIE